MPAPYEQGIPGGVQTTFAPGIGLSAPGRQERPREERLNQLKSLMVSAGAAVVGSLEGQARLAAIAERKVAQRKQEAMALSNWVKTRKAEEDNARQAAYRASANERLNTVQRSQFQIMRDPRSENAEWVLNEATMRQNNAQFPEERDAWMDFILRAQGGARQDAKQEAALTARVANADLISDSRIAARTAKTAIDSLWNDVQLDAGMRDELIGNGQGINDRVSQHVLTVAMQAAPQLFNLSKSDPMYTEKLEQQTILIDQLEARAQGTITDRLTTQFISNTNKASEAAGGERIEIGALAFAEGDMSGEEYHDLVGDTLRTQFAHVDPRQRDTIRERLYREQFDRLSQLLDQPNPGRALERMEALMSVADLNPHEQQVIRQQIIGEKFPKAVRDRLKQTFENKMAETSGIASLNDGRTIVPRDPRAVKIEMLENGSYRDIAGQMLDELGIVGDPSTLTPLQSNLLGEINATVMSAEQQAAAGQTQAVKSVERSSRFRSGAILSPEEAGNEWSEGLLMRTLGGRLSADDPVFQSIATAYRSTTGKDFPWDGVGPVPVTEETLPLLKDVAFHEGQQWARNKSTPIPSAMTQNLTSLILYDKPEKAELALRFWQGLDPESQGRIGQKLDARATMVMMEANRLYSQSAVGQRMAVAEIVNRTRTIDENAAMSALKVAQSQADAANLNPNPNFRYDYAKALAGALGEQVLKDEYGAELPGFELDLTSTFDRTGTKALGSLSTAFGTDEGLVPLFAQMNLVQQANPGTTLDEAAVIVAARMQSQGFKVVDGVAGKQIIRDAYSHYPVDVTPAVILQEKMMETLTASEAQQFVARLPNAGTRTQQAAADGATLGNILWTYRDELGASEGRMVGLPPPSEWQFLPVSRGPLFSQSMNSPSGGVPMEIRIPGEARTAMMLDKGGAPLLVVSSTRRSVTPRPVDRNQIPDNFLTPQARQRVKLRPDSAERLAQEFAFSPIIGQQN